MTVAKSPNTPERLMLHLDQPRRQQNQRDARIVRKSVQAMIGRKLGNYRLLSILGQGGMGAVFLAKHEVTRRSVAIKISLPDYLHVGSISSHFYIEAQAVSAVDHPNVVATHYVGYEQDDTIYIVMERLHGQCLKSVLDRKNRLSMDDALIVVRQLAEALVAVHGAGIVHRDIKPDNIIIARVLGKGEQVKLIDFGIAKMHRASRDIGHVTACDRLLGTPTYMSPEQCNDPSTVDIRSDLYSLGCIWFEMLCGRPPFQRRGIGSLLGAHVFKTPPRPRAINSSIPAAIERIILKLLSKQPEARFRDATELLAALPRPLRARSSILGDEQSRATVEVELSVDEQKHVDDVLASCGEQSDEFCITLTSLEGLELF